MVAPVDAVGCGLHESIDKDVPADGHYDAAGERAQRSALGGSVVVLRENKGACQWRLAVCVLGAKADACHFVLRRFV